jgi:hypothetical protein
MLPPSTVVASAKPVLDTVEAAGWATEPVASEYPVPSNTRGAGSARKWVPAFRLR